MKKIVKHYAEIHCQFTNLQKFQCVSTGRGLENIAKSGEVDKLKGLGFYTPNSQIRPQTEEEFSEFCRKTYEITCKLITLYDLIENEDPSLAKKISRYHSGINELNEVMGKISFRDISR